MESKILETFIVNGPWAVAAALLGWKILKVWSEDRKINSVLIGDVKTSNEALKSSIDGVKQTNDALKTSIDNLCKHISNCPANKENRKN